MFPITARALFAAAIVALTLNCAEAQNTPVPIGPSGMASVGGPFLPLSGGTMGGNIAMGGNNISGGGTITATTLAGTLSTAAQPNVTSLGTLTSLALSGAISGATTISGSGVILSNSTASALEFTSNTGGIAFRNDNTNITSPASNSIQLGQGDISGSPSAQTLRVQSANFGTNNAGANWTLIASLSDGTSNSGDWILQTGVKSGSSGVQATPTTALTVKGETQLVELPAITSDSGLTDAAVCEDTTVHGLYSGSGTLGICLGTSSERYKHDIADLSAGLPEIVALRAKTYYPNAGYGEPNKMLYGFIAEQAVDVLPKLAGYDAQNRVNTFDYLGVVPVIVHGMQQEDAKLTALRIEFDAYRTAHP
jgi:Chaperone of endosialidase